MVQYEDYCRSISYLFPLLFSVSDAKKQIQHIRQQPITVIQPGDSVYVHLRYFGHSYYESLGLPDDLSLAYVVEFRYDAWENAKHTLISATCPLFEERHAKLDSYFVFAYGSQLRFDPQLMILVDAALCLKFPAILPAPSRKRLLKQFA